MVVRVYFMKLLYIRVLRALPTGYFYYYSRVLEYVRLTEFLFALPTRHTLSSDITVTRGSIDEILIFMLPTRHTVATNATIVWSLFDGSVTHSPSTVYRHDILYSAANFPLDTVYTHDIIINEN